MNEPPVIRSRSLVWTDAEAQAGGMGRDMVARWFWSVSGPRGHMSGGEGTADAALHKAWAAMELLEDPRTRERKS